MLKWQLCKLQGAFCTKVKNIGRTISLRLQIRTGPCTVVSSASVYQTPILCEWLRNWDEASGSRVTAVRTVCCMVLALPLCSASRKIKALNISSLHEFPFSNFSLSTQPEQIIFPTSRTIFQENIGKNKSNPEGKLNQNIE